MAQFPFRRNPLPVPGDIINEDHAFAKRAFPPPYGPGGGSVPPQGPALVPGSSNQSSSQYAQYYQRLLRGKFMQIPFTAQIAITQIRPEELKRAYMFALNFHAANTIFLGFDTDPNATNSVPLAPNFGFYEPWVIPTNAIFVNASGANTPGVLIVVVD